jgi:hypothetical protein
MARLLRLNLVPLLVLTALAGPVEGAEPGRTAAAPRLPASVVEATPLPEASALRLDGELTDEVWGQAPAISGFLQREPQEGAPASLDTEFRVAYDNTHLYVAVRAHDPDPNQLVGILTRRDGQSPSDWIRVFIDSYFDRRTAFEFSVNPAGVKQDRYWFNDTNDDDGWDAVWDVEVRKDGTGWQAEFRIPFSQLRFTPNEDGRFGIAVGRMVARTNEVSSWPLLARSANGFVSQFGELRGLSLGKAAHRLELLPYAVASLATQPTGGNPLVRENDPDAALGLDLKYGIGAGLTLTATVNPDFGQVEADPAVVNLSAFETFFPERRPFFLEGSGIFRLDMDCEDDSCSGLFYSRRIGRTPQGSAEVPDEGYSEAPHQTTILGAAKLTGRVGSFSVGALSAFTAEESARVATAGGASLPDQPVEPFTAYNIVRVKREFSNQSSLGFMGTATNRRLEGALPGQLAGSAYTGGLDGDWRLGKRYSLSGFWAGSQVNGEPEAIAALQESNRHLYQRPDASHVEFDAARTSLAGQAGTVAFSKIGGERVRFRTSYSFKTPGLEINDLGFMQRADEQQQVSWVQFRRDRPSTHLRSWRLNLNQWTGWNFDGDRIYFGSNVNTHFQFQNNWRTGLGWNLKGLTFDDRATRGGPGAYDNPRTGGWHYLESDDRRMVGYDQFAFFMTDRYGSSNFEISPGVIVRPTSSMSVSTGLRYSRNLDDSQWVENVESDEGDRYVFGHLDQRTLGIRFRLNYTISTTLSLQLYGEPFVSTGAYTDFRELVDGRASAYEARYSPYAYEGNPDFRYASFRTTNVLRWEYRPGSTLFVVWQQGREEVVDDGRYKGLSGLGDVFNAPAGNVFLVKMAYWLNP